jgi:arylsulfatase A-like enzyme/Flp pilus assembly protein TadD
MNHCPGRRLSAWTAFFGLVLWPLLFPASARAAAPESSPNILIVTIDTLRPDRLSCYNPAYLKTPIIDALAASGVLFERAFAHTSVTLPSHANIFLGMTPPYHGVSENSRSKVGPEFLTLAEHLKAGGYDTGAFVGAFPLDSRFGLDQGFDVYDDLFPSRSANPSAYSERKAEDVLAAARAWLSGRTRKWFCWIHLWDPHAPYRPPEPYATRFKDDPYSGEAAYVDASLGSFFSFLKSTGRWAGTVLVLTADHGESLGEHGEVTHSFFAYNSTIHVPLLIAGPGIPALRSSQDVGHVDLFPTICRFLNLPAPPGLQGLALQPVWEKKTLPARPIYFEALDAYLNNGCAPLRGFIGGGMKFMDSPIPELYDLSRDFKEASNIAAKTDLVPYQKRLNDLRTALASPSPKSATKTVDRETRERLRSLGYLVGTGEPLKTSFRPADDLKSFLPSQQKLEEAILLVHEGKTAAGIALFEELIRDRKDFIAAYTFYAQALIADRRVEDALRVLDKGFRANPESYGILSAYGGVLIQAGQYDPAIGILEKTLTIMDEDPEIWDNLGIAYFNKGDMSKAIENYRRAIDLDRTFAFAYANLGVAYLARSSGRNRQPEDLREAIDHLKKAVALDPTFNPAFRALGVAHKNAGQRNEAIAAWEKSIALDPRDGFAVTSLATACLELGQKEKARTALEKYLKAAGSGLSPEERARVAALIEKTR